jgi:hypothetical protein
MLKPVTTFDHGASPYLPMGRHPSWPRNWPSPQGPRSVRTRVARSASAGNVSSPQLEERVVGAGGPQESERLFFEGVAGAPLTYI